MSRRRTAGGSAWLALLAAAAAGCSHLAPGASSIAREGYAALDVEGRARRVLVHLPPGQAPASGWPLVLVLHGHNGSAESIRRVSGMDRMADRAGFLVAYPEGTGWRGLPPRGWNAGSCCGYAMHARVDDVGFLRALITRLIDEAGVDPARVYVTGISNGAMMAHRAACELAGAVAAIAPVAGTPDFSTCHPAAPVSVLIVHGTADGYVPYTGGQGRLARDDRIDPPVTEAVRFWVAHNRCEMPPARGARGRIREERYAGGMQGAEVVLMSVEGGAHAWPGGAPGWRFGARPTRELSATDVIWDFFARHPLP